MTGGRKCLFCDSDGPLDKEDALPRWIGKIVIPEGIVTTTHPYRRNSYAKNKIVMRVGLVCKKCNSGWMSDLEGAAQPAIAPMITPVQRTRGLTEKGQRLVATWATKTAITMHFATGPGSPSAEKAAKWLYKHGEPQPNSAVFVAHYSRVNNPSHEPAGMLLTGYEYLPLEIQDAPVRAFIHTFWIGHFVAQVVLTDTEVPSRLNVLPEFDPYVTRVWPSNIKPRRWPPRMSMDGPTLMTFISAKSPAKPNESSA